MNNHPHIEQSKDDTGNDYLSKSDITIQAITTTRFQQHGNDYLSKSDFTIQAITTT